VKQQLELAERELKRSGRAKKDEVEFSGRKL
jgi:hypothetical protein